MWYTTHLTSDHDSQYRKYWRHSWSIQFWDIYLPSYSTKDLPSARDMFCAFSVSGLDFVLWCVWRADTCGLAACNICNITSPLYIIRNMLYRLCPWHTVQIQALKIVNSTTVACSTVTDYLYIIYYFRHSNWRPTRWISR